MESNKETLQKFPKTIRKYIQELWLDGTIVLSCGNVNIYTDDKKPIYGNDLSQGTNFVVCIPFAGKILNWEIIFNDEDLSLAPDFDFIDDEFLLDPDIDVIETDVPSLANWDIEDSKGLVAVIKEFLVLYKKYQFLKLQDNRYTRQYMEYSLLNEELGITQDEIEVLIDQKESVHFLIALKIDCSNLPPHAQREFFAGGKCLNPGGDSATLKVTYVGNKVTTTVVLSPRLEEILCKTNQLNFPPFNKDSGLVEYVPLVHQAVQNRIQLIRNHYNLCNNFISAFLAYQGHSVLEYDSINFMKISLMLEVENAYSVVTITLDNKFPQSKPKVQLLSISHKKNDIPHVENLAYPYSPKWTMEFLANKILTQLAEAVPMFKEDCIKF